MKAVYPPAQVVPYDPSFSGAFPPATRWTILATRAASGPAVTLILQNKTLCGVNWLVISLSNYASVSFLLALDIDPLC